MALKTPNLSVYCRNGAVINSISANWKTGELPSKNWDSVQKEYLNNKNEFLLGDFKSLARLLAMAGGDVYSSKNTIELVKTVGDKDE